MTHRTALVGLFAAGLAVAAWASLSPSKTRSEPPLADFVSESGGILVPRARILAGRAIWERMGGPGAVFGEGDDAKSAARRIEAAVVEAYESSAMAHEVGGAECVEHKAIVDRARREMRTRRYDVSSKSVTLSLAQSYAFDVLGRRVARALSTKPGAAPATRIGDGSLDRDEIAAVVSYLFWAGWARALDESPDRDADDSGDAPRAHGDASRSE